MNMIRTGVTTLGFGWVHYSFAFPVFSFLYSVRRQIPTGTVPDRPMASTSLVPGKRRTRTVLCFEFLLMFLKILSSGKKLIFKSNALTTHPCYMVMSIPTHITTNNKHDDDSQYTIMDVNEQNVIHKNDNANKGKRQFAIKDFRKSIDGCSRACKIKTKQ